MIREFCNERGKYFDPLSDVAMHEDLYSYSGQKGHQDAIVQNSKTEEQRLKALEPKWPDKL